MIDLASDTSVGRGFVGTYSDRAMQSHAFNRFVEKGFSSLCIAPHGEAKVNHLAICIDSTPQITPLATDADIGLVRMPVYARAAQVRLGPLGQFRAELLPPPIDSRWINRDAALTQQLDDVLIG